MTPQDFIRKWKPVALTERATAQEHFLDLCRLVGHPTPAEDDPAGDHFTFEKGAPKTGGGEGWADVWKKGFFAWEYKKKKRDLGKALEQLTRYAAALENPPLHVACDTHLFRIETRWTNEAPARYAFELEELADPVNFARLRDVFHNPEALRSGRTREVLTREAADKFQAISDRLQHRNPDREAVAHFINQLVFCFFADSVKLLPDGLWKKLLKFAEQKPGQAKIVLARLFDDMAKGGDFDLETILEFNGGLFDGRPPLALEFGEIGLLFAAASLDWSLIDPTIFGTLFERFLDPDKRAQIGAHYTDPAKIMMIVEPVVLRPLKAEWATTKAKIEAIMAPALEAAGDGKGGKREAGKKFEAARAKAEAERDAFIDRLCSAPHPRPSLRLRQFPLPRLAGREGHRMAGDPRQRGARPRHGCAARRAGNPARDRDQPVRSRARAHHHLDRRHPVAGEERHPAPPPPNPAQARCNRMPRRAASRRTGAAASSRRSGRRRMSSSATRRFWAAS